MFGFWFENLFYFFPFYAFGVSVWRAENVLPGTHIKPVPMKTTSYSNLIKVTVLYAALELRKMEGHAGILVYIGK